jgi:hypothetical protein
VIGQNRAAVRRRSLGSGARRVEKGEEATVMTDRSIGPIRFGVDQQADQARMGRPGQLGFGLFASKPSPALDKKEKIVYLILEFLENDNNPL